MAYKYHRFFYFHYLCRSTNITWSVESEKWYSLFPVPIHLVILSASEKLCSYHTILALLYISVG